MENYTGRIKTPVLDEGNAESMRERLRSYVRQSFALEETLFTAINGDHSFYVRADPLRHPLIFYFGHTPAFYINKMVCAKILPTSRRVNGEFEATFQLGVDEMSYDDLQEAHYNWPSVDEVREYRKTVLELVLDVIENMPIEMPVTWSQPAWIITMGAEHQRIHIETSSALIRQLPLENVRPAKEWQPCPDQKRDAPPNVMIPVDAGVVSIGKSDEATRNRYYGWDNEYGQAVYDVEPFQAAKYLVSNGEFLAFVNAGGYFRKDWWVHNGGGDEVDDAWLWRTKTGVQMPRYWRKQTDGTYRLRLLAEEVEMPWGWPVVVNNHEATAFCRWLSHETGTRRRLPTEAELVYLENKELPACYPDWNEAVANADLAFFGSSCPVDRFTHGRFCDLIGNVWQHTSTDFYALPGFKVHEAYPDFSAYQFDGAHTVMRGGCWATMGQAASASYRTAFRRHFYQHCGFRYVIGDCPPRELPWHRPWAGRVAEKLAQQYSDEGGQLANMLVQTAFHRLRDLTDKPPLKALDVGCSVGSRCFQLARYFDQVTGIDCSTEAIRAAVTLQELGTIQYDVGSDGLKTAALSDVDVDTSLTTKIDFQMSDACNPKSIIGQFDLVLVCDVLDRVYDPRSFLQQVHRHVANPGLLVISSNYDWRAAKTPMDKWLMSEEKTDDGNTCLKQLRELLEPHFELLCNPTHSQTLRDNGSKDRNEVTFWRRCDSTDRDKPKRTLSWL